MPQTWSLSYIVLKDKIIKMNVISFALGYWLIPFCSCWDIPAIWEKKPQRQMWFSIFKWSLIIVMKNCGTTLSCNYFGSNMARGKKFWWRVKGCQIGSLSSVVMQKVVSFLIPYCLASYFKVRLTKTRNVINCSVIAFSFLVHDINLPISIFF